MQLPQLIEKAKQVLFNAYCPYSNFSVGVCIRSENDQLFVGCNYENSAYPLASCAEGNAIASMIAAGCREIHEVVIMTHKVPLCPPCGGCRQRISEFAKPSTRIHLCALTGETKIFTLDELLPHRFDAKTMGIHS